MMPISTGVSFSATKASYYKNLPLKRHRSATKSQGIIETTDLSELNNESDQYLSSLSFLDSDEKLDNIDNFVTNKSLHQESPTTDLATRLRKYRRLAIPSILSFIMMTMQE